MVIKIMENRENKFYGKWGEQILWNKKNTPKINSEVLIFYKSVRSISECLSDYFLNFAYFDLNLSIRPAVSTNFILPV